MNIQKVAREVARASKRACHPEGLGNVIILWPAGDWQEEASANSVVRRSRSGGPWEDRLLCLRHPATAATIAEMIREAKRRAQEAK